MNRRNFLKSAAGILIAAPLVAKAENLMKVVVPKPTWDFQSGEIYTGGHDDDGLSYYEEGTITIDGRTVPYHQVGSTLQLHWHEQIETNIPQWKKVPGTNTFLMS